MRARRSWRAPWHPTVAIGARRCVGVGFSALPRRLRRVDRRNRSRSCQRLAIPSTLFAFGPRPASRQPATRTFVTGRECAAPTTDLDCTYMRSIRQQTHAAALEFPEQMQSHDRITRSGAPVVAGTLPPRLRPARTHRVTAGETQRTETHRTHDIGVLTATAHAEFTIFLAGVGWFRSSAIRRSVPDLRRCSSTRAAAPRCG